MRLKSTSPSQLPVIKEDVIGRFAKQEHLFSEKFRPAERLAYSMNRNINLRQVTGATESPKKKYLPGERDC
jgi:hypothetical protein